MSAADRQVNKAHKGMPDADAGYGGDVGRKGHGESGEGGYDLGEVKELGLGEPGSNEPGQGSSQCEELRS